MQTSHKFTYVITMGAIMKEFSNATIQQLLCCDNSKTSKIMRFSFFFFLNKFLVSFFFICHLFLSMCIDIFALQPYRLKASNIKNLSVFSHVTQTSQTLRKALNICKLAGQMQLKMQTEYKQATYYSSSTFFHECVFISVANSPTFKMPDFVGKCPHTKRTKSDYAISPL